MLYDGKTADMLSTVVCKAMFACYITWWCNKSAPSHFINNQFIDEFFFFIACCFHTFVKMLSVEFAASFLMLMHVLLRFALHCYACSQS